ncbi:MAG: response regulator transcription factor [bacterium]|nr:response regulator transcription factor [bacterium]
MTTTDKIRVLLVDDHEIVREGLRGFLRMTDDFELIGEAGDGAEAVRFCQSNPPDVILMDLKMPVMDGVEATRQIRANNSAVQVVILTSFDEEDLVQQGLQAGAIGYLLKNTSVRQLIAAIRQAHVGKPMLSPEATEALIQSRIRPPRPTYNLKPRELEVLALLVEGQTNEQIALKLHLSRSTVKYHVSTILSKLGVESRTEAVGLAVKEGLLEK